MRDQLVRYRSLLEAVDAVDFEKQPEVVERWRDFVKQLFQVGKQYPIKRLTAQEAQDLRARFRPIFMKPFGVKPQWGWSGDTLYFRWNAAGAHHPRSTELLIRKNGLHGENPESAKTLGEAFALTIGTTREYIRREEEFMGLLASQEAQLLGWVLQILIAS